LENVNELSGNASARASKLINRPGSVPGLVGAALLASLAGLRLIASADLNSVTFAGHMLNGGCWFRQSFGVPCPFCGMTRSVLLTLHGQLASAWQLNPAGLLLTFGLSALGCALVVVLLCEQTRLGHDAALRLQQRLRFSATAYAALFVAVLTTHWLAVLWAH
jgi:Protein of unknown function (DUF2752)